MALCQKIRQLLQHIRQCAGLLSGMHQTAHTLRKCPRISCQRLGQCLPPQKGLMDCRRHALIAVLRLRHDQRIQCHLHRQA